MKRPRSVGNKAALARLLGISRTWLYEFFKLPDHPKASASGQHSVAAWEKYIAKRAKDVQGATEREALQVAFLRCRVARAELELSEFDNTIRSEITEEITAACGRIMDTLAYQLKALPNQLAPRLEGLAPMPIFKMLRDAINARFTAAADALEKISRASRRKTTARNKKEAENIIRFDRARAATGGHDNGTT